MSDTTTTGDPESSAESSPNESSPDASPDAEAPFGGASAYLAPLMDRLDASPRYRLTRRFFHRYEGYAPPVLFLGGVGWDAATLQRIDAFIDNVILGVYLVLLGGFITLAVLKRSDVTLPSALDRLGTWSTAAVQFFAGGLFSAYVVYYSQSASLTTASLFLLLLVAVLVANEIIWDRTFSTFALLAIYFLAVFCFLTFFLPIVVGSISFLTFLASGVLSVGVLAGMIALYRRVGVFASEVDVYLVSGLIGALFLLMNLFYVQHWIPPVPLAMRYGGMFENVTTDGDAYVLHYQRAPWYAFWEDPDQEVIRHAPGDPVYAFAAIFAPTELNTKIFHRWQLYDAADETWRDTDRIGYRVVGGRRNGYRGYTYKANLPDGEWRVTVETEDARPVGRIYFTVESAPADSSRTLGEKRYR